MKTILKLQGKSKKKKNSSKEINFFPVSVEIIWMLEAR